MRAARLHSYFLLLLSSLIWGISAAVIKFTLSGIDPLPFLTYRFGIASVFAIFIFALFPQKLRTLFKNFWSVVFYGFITTTLTLGLLFLGLDRTTVLDLSLLTAIQPLLIVLTGHFFLNEHVTKREKLGIAIAFIGTLVTILEPVLRGGAIYNQNQLVGNLLIFAHLISTCVSSLLAKKLARARVDSFALSNVSFFVGFLFLLPFAHKFVGLSELTSLAINLPLNFQLGVFYMALISGTFAYSLWVKAQKTIEISEAGIFSYLVPIFAAPIGVFWLKETITFPFIVGAVIIGIGVIIAELKSK